MTSSSSWSVKGIEPSARAAAKAAAKRDGLTLGVWLSRAIATSASGGGEADAGTELGARLEGIEQALGEQARRFDSAESARRVEIAAARSSRRRWRMIAVGAVAVAVLAVGTTAVRPFLDRPVGERMASTARIEAPAIATPAAEPLAAPSPTTPLTVTPPPEPLATAGAAPEKFAAIAAPRADPAAREAAAGKEREDAEEAVAVAVAVAGTGSIAEDRDPAQDAAAGEDPGDAAAARSGEPPRLADDATDTPSPALESAALATVDEASEIDAETVERFLEAAREGSPEAQFNMGILYAEGLGVERDYGEALTWFERAAEQGLANAQYNLAVMHEHGLAGPRDAAMARQWYGRAAKLDHPQSQHNLAVIYARGNGVSQDYTAAAKWFAAAAEHGLVNAQYNLAFLYERGLGVARDEALAYRWFAVAEKRGDSSAGAARDALADRLGPVERAEIDRDVAVWRPLPAPGEEAEAGASEKAKANGEPALVARVQKLLADLGFDPGPTDGVSGAKTRQAIRDYQRRLGLAVDGRTSTQLLTHLRSVTGN